MCDAVDPFGRLKTRSVTAISSLVGSTPTSAVATAPLSTCAGVSSPPVSVVRMTTEVCAEAAPAVSVAPVASTQIHRSFRIVLSLKLIRAAQAQQETDQLRKTKDQRVSADPRVKTLRRPKALSPG